MKRANNRSDTWCFNTSERKESKGRKVGEANARPVCHIIQVLLGYGCTSNNHSKRFESKIKNNNCPRYDTWPLAHHRTGIGASESARRWERAIRSKGRIKF